MLQLSASLINKAVLSLRTGTEIAHVVGPIINPDSLKIEGFYCQDRFDKQLYVLLCQDIRDIVPRGYAVNDHDVLAVPKDLIRLKKIIDLGYDLLGKQVVTISKQKVGKVSDYSADIESMYIQKIYVAQSIFKSFVGGSLIIDRNQVNEITPTRIVINDLLEESPVVATATSLV